MNAPHFYAPDRQAWRQWLEKNHTTESAVWLVYDKGVKRTLSWQDIVEEALCFGWIDSRPGKVSDTQSKLYISKRKPRSVWSRINKAHVEKLLTLGLMAPAGIEAVELARSNGSWDALNRSDNVIIPPELRKLFSKNSLAKNNFEQYPLGSKRNTLQWIYDAKTAQTRTARIHKVYEAAVLGVRLR